MKSFVLVFVFVLGTSARIAERWAPCCFHLSASGAVTGTVGQLSDGQNRVNGPLSPAQYCIADGAITDANGRGCILTDTVTQWQCDNNASPASGFSIDCDGKLAYNDGTTFYECQTGDNGEANLYLNPGGTNCGEVTLKADACFSGCSNGCAANLNGDYEFPHLIIPVNSANPNTAAGTSYYGTVSSTISSIFNFDIPSSDSPKTCSLVFLFPTQSQLQTSSFTFYGNGGIEFTRLSSPATSSTTYNNQPGRDTNYGVTTVAPGNSYSIATFPCPAGTTVGFELVASGDTFLTYFQDYNPSPIGLYITIC